MSVVKATIASGRSSRGHYSHQPRTLSSRHTLQRACAADPAGAWYDPASVKIGYEINFNRYFYKPQALRPLKETRADLLAVQKEAERLLEEILG